MGDRQSGQDVRTQNVVACQAVGNIVKSSLGPVGLDKMLVDDIGDVTITNDGATIVKMLGVEHPATKVLVELAKRQDREVGDGKTSVFIILAELLKRANDLARNMIHPTSISLASRKACKYFDKKLAVKVEKLGKDSLINCAKTSMSSKLISSDSDFFANLVVAGGGAVEAALSVYLEYLDTTLGSREQSTEFVAKLWAYHHSAQTKADKKHLSSMGLDLFKGIVRNNFEALVIKPAMSDAKIIQLVSEAAIIILRIDNIIKLVKDESQDRE